MNDRYTFDHFLSGFPMGKYTDTAGSYAYRIGRTADMIRQADYVLLGSGSGMSLAAGAQYGGDIFKKEFAEFRKVYGEDNPYMQDTYSAGFYPFPDEESFWGMWCRLALFGGADLDVTPLHRTVLDMIADKNHFLLTTNVDHQFEKAGLPAEKTFATQGSYNHIQCRRGCHPKTYPAKDLFRRMNTERRNGRIPSELVPKCPVCGGAMTMNLRCDEFFVQDEAWYEAESKFSDFLSEAIGGKLVLIELGVGFNTPTIIRFPFDRLCCENENVSLIRLNNSQAAVPQRAGDRAVGIEADMSRSLADMAGLLIRNRG